MKMTKFRFLLANTRLMAGDEGAGEASSGEAGAGEGAGGDVSKSLEAAVKAAEEGAAKGEKESDSEKLFNQSQVNDYVIKRNKGVKQQLETAEATIETMLQNQQLTTNQRGELETQLTTLQATMRTTEQQTAHNASKAKIEYEASLEVSQTEAKKYKNLFETQTTNNAILASAAEHDAFNPELFIDVLGPRTAVVAEVDEQGVETGRQVPKVRSTRKAEDGTVTEVFLTPDEAIIDMKNDPTKFGGLFRGNVAKGIGEGSNSSLAGESRIDVSKMTTEEYMANRKAIAKQLNLPERRTF